jgi:hypothetical protein
MKPKKKTSKLILTLTSVNKFLKIINNQLLVIIKSHKWIILEVDTNFFKGFSYDFMSEYQTFHINSVNE